MNYCRSLLLVATLFGFPLATQASQELYNFGYFKEPQTVFDNPVGLAHCKNQFTSGLTIIDTNFETDSAVRDYEVEQQGNSGNLKIGACLELVDWITVGFDININALTFDFQTEQNNNRKIYPYLQNSSPILGFGSAIKLTEKVSWGISVQTIATVDLFFAENFDVDPEESQLTSSLGVTVRPEYLFATGLSYEVGDLWKFKDVTLYSSWRQSEETEFTFDLDLGLVLSIFGLTNPIETDFLTVIGKIESIPEKYTVGAYGTYEKFDIDFSITQERWSKMNDPFFKLSLPLDVIPEILLDPLNELLFPTPENIEFKDTFNLNVLVKYPYTDKITLLGGYGYRGDPVASEDKNPSILGSDLHIFKGGFTYDTKLGEYPIQIGGHMIYGHLMETDFGDNESIDGNYMLFEGATRLFF